jgi:heat shock protein HtpX
MLNTLKVGVLLTILTTAFIGMGYAIGGTNGTIIAFGLALVMNFGSYWFSDKIVLSMYGAQQLDPSNAPDLFRMTEQLAQRAGIPMPKLYIINDPQPNAFATGRNPQNAAVAVNQGLLDLLSRDEVEGVIAHELAHVKHRDTLTMSVVATIAGAIMMLAQMGQFAAMFGGHRDDEEGGTNPFVFLFMIIIAPIAATLVQMAVSRAREFEADASAARYVGSPNGLINALSKLERGVHAIPSHTANPQTAHMFIANPLAGRGAGVMNLFMTHPPMEKRIVALQALRDQVIPAHLR